ncbi:MAG: EAL domain-containing protein [Hyphomicrobiales bacterium]
MKLMTAVTGALALLTAIAAALCLFALLRFHTVEYALTGAVLLLALAQIASYLARRDRSAGRERLDLVKAVAETNRAITTLGERVGELEGKFADADLLVEAADRMQDEVRALQKAVARFGRSSATRDLRRSAQTAPPPPQANNNDPYALDLLPEHDLLLEPVVRLDTGDTHCYRAGIDVAGRLPSPDGDPLLDYATICEVLPVIARLRAKGRSATVLCPVSEAALADPEFVHRLVDLLAGEPDTVGSLVLDLDQRALARLSQPALEGLAWLGENGAQFCLSGADTESPDIPALAQLRFAFLDIDAALVRAAAEVEPAEARYVATRLFRNAAEHGVAVIASNLAREGDLASTADLVALGRGPLFSPPRRVRQDAARTGPAARVA